MSLRPPSQNASSASGELRTFPIEDRDLQIARELERQILEAQIWERVAPIVDEVATPFLGHALNEATMRNAQRALDERLKSLGPDFPLPGVKLILKLDPSDPYTLLLELQ